MNRLLARISLPGEHTSTSHLRLVIFLAIMLAAGTSTRAHAECGMPKQLLFGSASKAAASTSRATTALHQQISTRDPQEFGDGHAREPIVGLWRIVQTDDSGNILDRVISGWTSDGLEFDQDISPILTGYVCYGTWVKLGHRTYGLTHPFFTFQDVNSNGEGSEATEGQWDGNSAYFDYKVTVDETGKTFTGKGVIKLVQGPDPYDPNATVLFANTFNVSASKIEVDKSLLP